MDVRCPNCGALPALKVTGELIAAFEGAHPDTLVQSYQCSWQLHRGKRCGTRYAITAGAIQRATL